MINTEQRSPTLVIDTKNPKSGAITSQVKFREIDSHIGLRPKQ